MSTQLEPLLTVAEVSEILNVPVSTLYQWSSRGIELTGMRLGRHLRYDPAAVRAWLDEQRTPRQVT